MRAISTSTKSRGDAYGFGGLTQERRYIAGKLEVAPRRAPRHKSDHGFRQAGRR